VLPVSKQIITPFKSILIVFQIAEAITKAKYRDGFDLIQQPDDYFSGKQITPQQEVGTRSDMRSHKNRIHKSSGMIDGKKYAAIPGNPLHSVEIYFPEVELKQHAGEGFEYLVDHFDFGCTISDFGLGILISILISDFDFLAEVAKERTCQVYLAARQAERLGTQSAFIFFIGLLMLR
jgi:hypothetical protein